MYKQCPQCKGYNVLNELETGAGLVAVGILLILFFGLVLPPIGVLGLGVIIFGAGLIVSNFVPKKRKHYLCKTCHHLWQESTK